MTTTHAPARTRATALPADERRSMIIEATLPLLVEHGDRVTSRQIAEAAGIAEGTIFRVFADKDELVRAVIDAALDLAPLEEALDAIPHDLEFEPALRAAIAILQQRVTHLSRLLSNVGPRFHDETRRPMQVSAALVRLFDRYADGVVVEPVVAARLLRALAYSMTLPMIAVEPLSVDEVLHLFLRGVGTGA